MCNFTGAAKALGLTQAAVSQRIQALEKTLNKSLFERRAGRVLLTEAGRQLYTYVQRILDLHREAWKEMRTASWLLGSLTASRRRRSKRKPTSQSLRWP